MKLPQNNTYK